MSDLKDKLRKYGFKNQSIQDIFKTCVEAVSVISVEPYNGKHHNTKMTLTMDKGSLFPSQERTYQRVHLYNRTDIATVLPPNFTADGSFNDTLNTLNVLGCDFTADDLVLAGSLIRTTDQSLGYFNKSSIPVNPFDYAFLEVLFNYHALTVNGITYPPDQPLQSQLEALGVVFLHIYDSHGCNEVFRYQNSTNTALDIEITGDNNYMGFSGLITQPNQTLQITEPNTGGASWLFNRAKFSLAPRNSMSTEHIADIPKIFNDLLASNQPTPLVTIANNSNAVPNPKQNLSFEIRLNDVTAYNGLLGDVNIAAAQAALNQRLSVINSGYVLSLGPDYWNTGIALGVTSHLANEWLKITVIVTYENEFAPVVNDGVLGVLESESLTTFSGNQKTAEFYLYDAFNF